MTMRRILSVVLAGATLGACDDRETVMVPIGVQITPLSTGTSCGDPNSPNANPSPFSDAPNVSIAVRGVDAETGEFGTLLKKSGKIREGQSLRIGSVPEGLDRELIVFARGSQDWYGRDTHLDITRNGSTPAGMVLTKHGGFTCVPSPDTMTNVVFPAVVTLGDGRVMSFGGFSELDTSVTPFRLEGPTSQAMLFDSRTGVTTVIPFPAQQARGGATAVYMPETNKVVVFGGARSLLIDGTKDFPLTIDDPDELRADVLVFDVTTGTFDENVVEEMSVGRVFPRAARLGDGTILVNGGGRWPLDAEGDDSHLLADIFDPEDNDQAGGFLDIPPLRGFYPRTGHSITVLRQTDEGLTQLLIWGGTTPGNVNRLGEVFKQSGRQQDGVNGTFAEVTLVGDGANPPRFTFFHEMTKLSNNLFLVTGGAPMEGDQIRAPRNDESWIVEYQPNQPTPTFVVTQRPGLGEGRVFHTALSDDLRNVAVVGGWNVGVGTNFRALQADFVRLYDAQTSTWSAADGFATRGGHGAALTSAGTIMLIGGETDMTQLQEHRLVSEIFTPSFVPVP